MEIVRTVAHARVGILGNPSDGFFGKTIAAAIHNFAAEIVLYEWPVIEILRGPSDLSRFSSMDELVEDVKVHGYYGAVRLVKAAIKRFHDWALSNGFSLERRSFSVRYDSNIPRQVGLAGSSAIVTATLRALMAFYEIEVPKAEQPGLILWAEVDELGITAGLQTRPAGDDHDAVSLSNVASGSPTTIFTGDGNNTITVGGLAPAETLALINDRLHIVGGILTEPENTDTLIVSDALDTLDHLHDLG